MSNYGLTSNIINYEFIRLMRKPERDHLDYRIRLAFDGKYVDIICSANDLSLSLDDFSKKFLLDAVERYKKLP